MKTRWVVYLVGLGLCACAPADEELASRAASLVIDVPGDYASIQAACDAAAWGDTVLVAPGDYYENIRRVGDGVILKGSGPSQTVLHGQISFWGTEFGTVTGFKVTAAGAAGLSPNVGISATGDTFRVFGNVVEGFGSGIGAEAENIGEIYGNLVRQNQFGIELGEVGPAVMVHHNLALNNSNSGIMLFGFCHAHVKHNTVVGNGFAASFDVGGAGISIGPFNFETVQNNIVVSNKGGINSIQDSNSRNHHNLVWGNATNYVGDARVGEGDLSLDPRFVDPSAKDFRLQPGSPAVDAGLDLGLAMDYDGNPRLVGAAPDLGAFEVQNTEPDADLVINEVLANPLDEARGEFVELFNPTEAAIDAAGLALSDGDALDILQGFQGGATLIPAGGFAVVLDSDYAGLAEPYEIPAEAVLLTVGNAALGSGLSTSDPVTLLHDGATISSYSQPFNPGNGVSAERIDSLGADEPGNWVASPCGASPGRANCISSGGGGSAEATLAITEVMATPEVQASGEFVELFNYGDAAVELAGLVLSDGDSTDALVAVAGKDSELLPGAYGVVVDPDLIPTMEGAPYQLDASVPTVVSVGSASLGNGLTGTDPVTLLAADGATVLSTFSHPLAVSGQSVERIDPLEADLPDNWQPCPCAERHSAGRANCASGGGGPMATPDLVITEVMANPLDEDQGEFIEIFNADDGPVDAAGLVLSDGDAADVLEAFPGQGTTVIPAGGYGLVLDPEYVGGYAIASEAVWLAPGNSTLGNGLQTTDPISLLAADGVTVISSCSFPGNPGNGISLERLGDAGDVASNWTASTCAAGSSPGGPNCAGGDPEPDPATSDLVISEVLANPVDEAKGEFVEIVNTGTDPLDLDGHWLSDGDATDPLQGYLGGPTELAAGAIAVVLDPGYAELVEDYDIPAGAVLLTVDDNTLGSGLSTDDPLSLLAPDGVSVLSTYGSPFNPGNGISAERIDLAADDTPDNWVASPCASGSSPGAVNCADQGSTGTMVDVNLASAEELEQVHGIGPSTAAAIVAYREASGPYESLVQLTVIEAVTPAKVDEWRVAEEGEAEFVIGLEGARELMVFDGVADLLAALPDPASPNGFEDQPVRINRAACLTQSDSDSTQDLLFADWGDAGQFEPAGGAEIPVFLDRAPGEAAYHRDQTDHANAMADWIKEDGDPYRTPDLYRWETGLWSYGAIAYAHVFALEGVVEVDGGAWRLRIRARTDAGIDRVVLIERWLEALEWQGLQTVWTYNYKGTVVESIDGYTYSLPHRLALAHPCRQWWFDQHGVWIDVPRCQKFGECTPMLDDWASFNQALAAYRQDPGPTGDVCFTYDYSEYCFTVEEELLGLEILNGAGYEQLTDHCYSSTLANTVLNNRPFANVAAYDDTPGVGPRSLWNLLVCYVRSGDWPEAAEGTVARVLQDIPDNEWSIVSVDEAEVTTLDGRLFDVCDPGTDDCIAVYSYAALPAGLEVDVRVRLTGQVKYYTNGDFWELTVDGGETWVAVISDDDPRPPQPGELLINEFLADPGNELCDANCDGVRNATGDEFVELVNVSPSPLILDGVTFSDSISVRHTFAAGTLLAPGEPIVIFGGGSLDCAAFDDTQVVLASSGGLSLNNTGDTLTVAEAGGATICRESYGDQADHEQSLTLSPDLNDLDDTDTGVGPFELHMTADDAGDRSRMSPGRRIDGTPFVY